MWAAVFAWPMAIWCLKVLVECIAISCGFKSVCSAGKSCSFLKFKLDNVHIDVYLLTKGCPIQYFSNIRCFLALAVSPDK